MEGSLKKRIQKNKQIERILEIFSDMLNTSDNIIKYKVFSVGLHNKIWKVYDEISDHWHGKAHR